MEVLKFIIVNLAMDLVEYARKEFSEVLEDYVVYYTNIMDRYYYLHFKFEVTNEMLEYYSELEGVDICNKASKYSICLTRGKAFKDGEFLNTVRNSAYIYSLEKLEE